MSRLAVKRGRSAEEEDVELVYELEDGEEVEEYNYQPEEEGKDDEWEQGGYFDDDDEDEPWHQLGNPVLPVADLPESFNGVPQDGLEYLFTVRRQERNLPFVAKVKNPYVTEDASTYKPTTTATWGLIPCEEWQKCFEDRFRNLRANLSQPLAHIPIPESSPPTVPETRDRDRWWAFFRGDGEWHKVTSFPDGMTRNRPYSDFDITVSHLDEKMRAWLPDDDASSTCHQIYNEEGTELTGNPEDNMDEDAEDSEGEFLESAQQEDDVTTRTENESPNKGVARITPNAHLSREPTPRILSVLDQKTILQILKFFTSWIQGHFDIGRLPPPPECVDSPAATVYPTYELTPSHARWIFALLTRLDTQLTGSEINVLRNLVREIFRIIKEERSFREKGPSSSTQVMGMGETGCWMIVAAVSGVWGQRDLWMDAAAALR